MPRAPGRTQLAIRYSLFSLFQRICVHRRSLWIDAGGDWDVRDGARTLLAILPLPRNLCPSAKSVDRPGPRPFALCVPRCSRWLPFPTS